MKYKEFVIWCNKRASDGHWGPNAAILSLKIIRSINDYPFWKREKIWRNRFEDFTVKSIVNPIENKIKEVYFHEY